MSDALPLANLEFPTSKWRAGEIVRSQLQITIPANATTGTTNLSLALIDDNNSVTGDLVIAPFTIEKTDRVFIKPAMQFEQAVNFANAIALVGYQCANYTSFERCVTIDLVLAGACQDGKSVHRVCASARLRTTTSSRKETRNR